MNQLIVNKTELIIMNCYLISLLFCHFCCSFFFQLWTFLFKNALFSKVWFYLTEEFSQ